jgi:hypothetical protein
MTAIDARGFVSWGLWGEGGVQLVENIEVEMATSPEIVAVAMDTALLSATLEADEITVEIGDE